MQRRRIALLALLSVARQHGVMRDRLIGYLWPDADPDRARAMLSDSLYRINQAVDGEAIVAVGDALRLIPERLPCDAWEFASAIDAGDWQRAAALHVAPLLDGFFLTGADELERWVDAQRERMRREHARALEALAEAAEHGGATVDAVAWWRLLAAQDPYSTRIALRLVRALDRAGDRAAALQHAQTHASLLEQDLGLAPERELLDLVTEFRTAPSTGTTTVPAAPPCVAVLPFLNLGGEPADDYFTDGITEDVIAHLSRIRALRVISRASVMQFRRREPGLREIGARLGASALLDGSVRRIGERVRVVAQLIDARTEQCLWAETYDRWLTDVFAIQTDVALHIASALQARLSPDERSRIRKEPTRNLQAYQLYLQGRHCITRFNDDGLVQGIAYLQQAVELDPDYALAYANIALAYEELGEVGSAAVERAYLRAREAAFTALRLDPGLAEAHCVTAHAMVLYDHEWEAAEREFRCALELSPSSADTCNLYGRMCAAVGRFDEAVALIQRAQQLDPVAHRSDLATALIRAGRYEEALDTALRAVAFEPHYARSRATLGWACLMLGRTAEGMREIEAAVTLAPENTSWLGQLGLACARTGRTDRARDILRQLEQRAQQQPVSPYHIAYVHTGLGDHERALDYLELACEQKSGAVHGVKGAFLFEPLRGHPRFAALLRRLNLS